MIVNRKTTKILLWVLVLGWMMLMFSFSAQPATESANLSGGVTLWMQQNLLPLFDKIIDTSNPEFFTGFQHVVRKLAHMFLYFVLGVLLSLAVSTYKLPSRIKFGLALSVSLLYAMSDEFHQAFIPGRGPQISDVFIDLIGAVAGCSLVFLLLYIRGHKKRN